MPVQQFFTGSLDSHKDVNLVQKLQHIKVSAALVACHVGKEKFRVAFIISAEYIIS